MSFESFASQTASLARKREDFFRPQQTGGGIVQELSASGGKTMAPPVSASKGSSGGEISSPQSKPPLLSSSLANGDSSKASRGRSPPPQPKYAPTTNGAVRELHGYVGFANIPNQVYRKAIKQGFDFTLMVVGQSGLGKSTFINSLFLTDIYPDTGIVGRPLPETVKVEEQTVRLTENGVNLNLTLVDTPGFGDQVDNSKCWGPVIQWVDKKYSDFFTEETKILRAETIPDNRVHCCLYFIAPTGHGLKPLDVEFMKNLHDRVNIVPVIAKADTMTPEELKAFKRKVLAEIKEQKIKIYQFPDVSADEEDNESQSMRSRVPFAVIGSNLIQDNGHGKKVRCRKYPWGVVEVENLEHNDFMALRNMIIRANMIDLVDVTRSVHYENFRCRQLMTPKAKLSNGPKMDTDKDPFTLIETEKKDHVEKMRQNHQEMERVFQEKVQEKQQKFKQHEQEIEQKVSAFTATLEAKRAEIEQKKRQVTEFKEQYPQLASYASSISVGSGSDAGKRKKLGFFK